ADIQWRDRASAFSCRRRANRLQRALEFGRRKLHTAFSLRQPVPLASPGWKRVEIHLAAAIAERIRKLLGKGRRKIAVIGGDQPGDRRFRGLAEFARRGLERMRRADLIG